MKLIILVKLHACMLSCFSHVHLFATLWTVACQAPLSMGFSRQEYWSGLPCPPPGDLRDPGIKPMSPASPALQADSLLSEPPGKPLSTTKRQIPESRLWYYQVFCNFSLEGSL